MLGVMTLPLKLVSCMSVNFLVLSLCIDAHMSRYDMSLLMELTYVCLCVRYNLSLPCSGMHKVTVV